MASTAISFLGVTLNHRLYYSISGSAIPADYVKNPELCPLPFFTEYHLLHAPPKIASRAFVPRGASAKVELTKSIDSGR